MNAHDRDRERDPDAPDPTQDTWSAWLPQLDAPASPGSPTGPGVPGSTAAPLPQASGPPTGADPAPPAVPPAPPLPHAVTPPWAGPHRVGPAPTTYFGWAVVCAIFCFTPLGIVAVVKSLQVRPRWSRGDWIGAEKASRAAKTWCLVAAAIWPGSVLLFSCLGALTGGHMFMHL